MEIEQIIKTYLKVVCLLLGINFQNLEFSYSEDNNNFYCYINSNKETISLLIGYKGRNAIAIRRILAILLRKNKISRRVKLIFGKK